MQLSADCPCLKICGFLIDLAICQFSTTGIKGEMKLLDICVIALVSMVCLSRFSSPHRSLKSDLIAKSSLAMLSAVCQLVGLIEACDYFATRLSTGSHHPGWIAVESAGWLSSGLLLGPACRSFLSKFSSKKLARTLPAKAPVSPIKFRLTR
jgi:hypothetical protein